jgi:cell division protein FtsN
MTEQQKAPDQDATNEEDPRKQLWVRVSVAGGLIAVLLGGLAVFDHLSRPPVPAEIALPTKPIAPAQVVPEAGRDAPPDVLRAGSEGDERPLAEDVPAEPEGSAPPRLPVDDKLEPAGKLAEGTRPLRGAPASAGASVAQPLETVRQPLPRGEGAPGTTHSPAVQRPPVTAPVPVSVPGTTSRSPAVLSSTPAATRAPTQQASPAGGSTPAPGAVGKADVAQAYVVQFGVFSNLATAEGLRARLAQAGIPSQLEVRVVVGPFADRKDAVAAQARLRDKGIDVGTLIPLGR